MASYIEPTRLWEEFVFSDEISLPDDLTKFRLSELIPESPHIRLRSASRYESSHEHSLGEFGFFTKILLETLQKNKGPITYYELIRRIQIYMQYQKFNQTPQIYVPRGFQRKIYQSFLSRKVVDQPLTGKILYSRKWKKWILDLGGIHGLKANRDEESYHIFVDTGGEEPAYASIIEVFTTHSFIEFEPYSNVSIISIYEGYIGGLMTTPISIIIEGDLVGRFELLSFFEQQNKKLVEESSQADYKVLVEDDFFAIVRSNDPAKRPLTEYIRGTDLGAAEKVIDYLTHIGKWTFIKNLKNEDTIGIGDNPIQLTVKQRDKEVRVLSSQNSTIVIPFGDDSRGEAPPQITITLENTTQRTLYVACLYLSSLFGVEVNYLEPTVVKMKPRQEAILNYGDPITLNAPDYILSNNWPEETVYLKIIASTVHFDVNIFNLPELPMPNFSLRGGGRGKANREIESKSVQNEQKLNLRGTGMGYIRKKGFANISSSVDDWSTQLFTFSLVNPNYREPNTV